MNDYKHGSLRELAFSLIFVGLTGVFSEQEENDRIVRGILDRLDEANSYAQWAPDKARELYEEILGYRLALREVRNTSTYRDSLREEIEKAIEFLENIKE